MSATPYADVDAQLLQLAELVDEQLGERIRRLVDAEATVHEVIDLRARTQRAEDLAEECRRQLAIRDRQCDQLRIQLARAEAALQ